jgi:DNA damage-binding protein 1
LLEDEICEKTCPAGNSLICIATRSKTEPAKLKLFASIDLKLLDSFHLGPGEAPTSLTSTHSLDEHSGEVIILGTAFYSKGDVQIEASRGRIICFSLHGTVEDRKRLKFLTQAEVEGGVYALAVACGRVVACVNKHHMIFKYSSPSTYSATQSPSISTSLSSTTSSSAPTKNILTCLSAKLGQICGVSLSVQGEYILVGDVLKSVSLFKISEDRSQLESIGFDSSSFWMTAGLLFGPSREDSILGLGGDTNGNLIAYGMDVDPLVSTRKIVKVKSGYFLESPIVKISFLSNGDKEKILLFSASGALYILLRETFEIFSLFKKVEHLLATRLLPQHTYHRQLFSMRREQRVSSDYFVDGSLLLRFLEIEAKERNEIAEQLGYQAPVLCSLLQKHLLS